MQRRLAVGAGCFGARRDQPRGADCRCARSAPGRPDAVPALGVPLRDADAAESVVDPRLARRISLRSCEPDVVAGSARRSAERRCAHGDHARSAERISALQLARHSQRESAARLFGAPSSTRPTRRGPRVGGPAAGRGCVESSVDPRLARRAPLRSCEPDAGPRFARSAAERRCAHGDHARSAERISALQLSRHSHRESVEGDGSACHRPAAPGSGRRRV